MNYLNNFFKMERATPVDGEDRYMGQTESKLGMLETIGKKENLTSASLMVFFPNDKPELVVENTAIALRFLKNVAPEWKDSSDWFNEAIEKFGRGVTKESKVIGEKAIEMTFVKEFGMVMVTAKGK
jgi:hypothetical protein